MTAAQQADKAIAFSPQPSPAIRLPHEQGRVPRQFHWHDFHVPFITPWDGEGKKPGAIERRRGIGGEGIGYADEDSPVDRRAGALWVRMAAVRGGGRPLLRKVHPLRQRQAMSHQLCQVCGGHTCGTRSDERTLFVMASADGRPISEGELTVMPPVHEVCALEAVEQCPELRKGHVAALVGDVMPWGVAGIVHDRTTLQPLIPDDEKELTFVGYDDPRFRWVLAMREVVSLREVTPVDLHQLTAHTGQQP
ncbi:hypothetical protein MUU72_05200 [Streptomyces sp. RS10V-4]|uniref:hypothetical protein n=1 Tax=Streptomyces rhizoryzae TaxID=2932493 RepID=UPI00200544BC|nr:hypothetical protein [Streptomyces rhizoryzae]MCK7622510.1 hypothetical protein [Streptomyces rhizoryzae]